MPDFLTVRDSRDTHILSLDHIVMLKRGGKGVEVHMVGGQIVTASGEHGELLWREFQMRIRNGQSL